jgi:hypothetical protein
MDRVVLHNAEGYLDVERRPSGNEYQLAPEQQQMPRERTICKM